VTKKRKVQADDWAAEQLERAGLKKTGARIGLLSSLQRAEHQLKTADDLWEDLDHTVDKVTIYRALSQLEKAGLVESKRLGDRKLRYELSFPSHCHHHIVCTECEKVELLPDCKRVSFEKVASQLGFQ